ncbi:hypothetical protein Cva_00307 [Caedimonas varicaedens]|uniref:Uncharacterized protein n=1 Tax=Caedimonas varicaedens TaxID=1629334 RepID=A0A0K8MAY8_9PROT|nr:hypothetical protein Cva_00307 [Caedimonas varicaedens]
MKTEILPPLNPDTLVVRAVPPFPAPTPSLFLELQGVCGKDKCPRLYDWLGKLMIFEKQLDLYETEFSRDKPHLLYHEKLRQKTVSPAVISSQPLAIRSGRWSWSWRRGEDHMTSEMMDKKDEERG